MPRRFAAAVALFYVPLALGALAWIAWRAGAEGLRDRLVGPEPLFGLAVGVFVGAASAFALQLSATVWGAGRRLEAALASMIGPLSPASCALLALASGIAEELAFRAALQPEIGLVPTALLFGAVHAPLRRELLAWTVLAAVMGLLLGWLFLRTGSVIAPVAAHVVVNGINLRYLARRAAGRSEPDPA